MLKVFGGILTLEDLAGYKSQYAKPVSTTFKGYEVLGHDTWTQGPMVMQALNLLEHFDLRQMGHNTPALHSHPDRSHQVNLRRQGGLLRGP